MSRALGRTGWYMMAILAAGTALWSLRFAGIPAGIWFSVDPGIAGVVRAVPLQALIHMIAGPIALIVGPFQFVAGLRGRRPGLHRWLGRLYVAACIVSGVAALATAPFASGGPVAGLGFGLLAMLWVATTFRAWRAAVGRDLVRHRRLMLYSYAMTFAAVTLRIQIPLGLVFLHAPSYSAESPWLAFTCWIPNVAALWLWLGPAEKPRRVPA